MRRRGYGGAEGAIGEREEQALALWNALKDREQLLARAACVGCERCRGRGPFRRKPAHLGCEREKAKEEEPAKSWTGLLRLITTLSSDER